MEQTFAQQTEEKRMRFAQLVKSARQEAHIGIRDLAAQAGIRRRYIQKLERGSSHIQRYLVIQILSLLFPVVEDRQKVLGLANEIWTPRKARRQRSQSSRRRDMRKQKQVR